MLEDREGEKDTYCSHHGRLHLDVQLHLDLQFNQPPTYQSRQEPSVRTVGGPITWLLSAIANQKTLRQQQSHLRLPYKRSYSMLKANCREALTAGPPLHKTCHLG